MTEYFCECGKPARYISTNLNHEVRFFCLNCRIKYDDYAAAEMLNNAFSTDDYVKESE